MLSEGTGPRPQDIGPMFLKEKYSLHTSEEVKNAAKRTEIRTGEKVPQDPETQIQNYLDRFNEILNRENPEKRAKGIEALKNILYDSYLVKYEEIPESYWKSKERELRERGQGGDWEHMEPEQKEKTKKLIAEAALEDQRASLEQWIDYLASKESNYIPDAMKYWFFRNITKLSEFDKYKNEFPERSNGTLKKFPDLNQEALNYVLDALINKYKKKEQEYGADIQLEDIKKFNQFLETENFAKLYSWANELYNPIPERLLSITKGKWIRFERDSDHQELIKSLHGKGTGWCIAGQTTSKNYLSGGDIYIYFSEDDSQNAVNPRIAIRMEGDNIAEVRGIAQKQNLDSFMSEILGEKLEDFPDKDKYLKREHDMKTLTKLENKVKKGEALNRDDLLFLYEINSKIEGFGINKDPRIKEIRSKRVPNEDAPIILNCNPDQIAHSKIEVNKNTKAYIGPLYKNIFTELANIEEIYTTFPEGKIKKIKLEMSGESSMRFQDELSQNNLHLWGEAEYMLNSDDFEPNRTSNTQNLIIIEAGDLVFSNHSFSNPNNVSMNAIVSAAAKLGLERCSAETGPALRLQNNTKNKLLIVMNPILNSKGRPCYFQILFEQDEYDAQYFGLDGIAIENNEDNIFAEKSVVLRIPNKEE